MIAAGAPAFAAHLEAIDELAPALEAIGGDPPPAPRWNQDWFPRLDGAAAYAMVRRHRPARIVEVGSGHSTRFLERAVADGALKAHITAIDPRPRASLEGLPIELLRTTVQAAGCAPFENLRAGDFLFVDSSHKRRPGSDVAFLFEQVLPTLPGGVFVHFHDIFLPGGYPEQWAWRRYNEQTSVAAEIAGGGYALEFSSAWIIACRPEWLAKGVLARLPLVPGAFESSLWLRRLG